MISKPTTVLGWAKITSAAFAVVLVLSWVAGQCRAWRTPHAPKAPPPIPGAVDPGAPVAGPTADRPTVTTTLAVARPALTREEVLAEAKRVGLVLAPAPVAGQRAQQAPAFFSSSADEKQATSVESGSMNETDALEFPLYLGKERFHMVLGAAGEVALEVQAWQLEPGAKIDLRGKWEDYQPPPPAPATTTTCPGGSGFFGNEARWEKEIAVGAIGTADGFGPGGSAALTYRGPRTVAANWGATARVMGGKVGTKTPFMGLAAARVSW